MDQLFSDISIIILLACALAIIFRALKQPPLLAYLTAGVLAGPVGFGLLSAPELLKTLSAFGIAFLLFSVGLELDIKHLRKLGKRSLVIGLAQIIFTVGVGWLITQGFGVSGLASWYISLALTFSSTIIIIKLLTERQEMDSLSGRLSMGILLLQDVVAILALVFFSSTAATELPLAMVITLTLAKLILLVGSLVLVSLYLLPKLFSYVARSSELLFLTAIAWCFLVVMTTVYSGFSIEIGALLAGLALAPLPFNFEINARLKGLRDFFVTLFFVALGAQLTFTGLGNLQSLFWALTAFVLIGNPLIVIATMSFMGYRRRTSFFTAITFGMVSEFSFILMGVGLQLGQVTANEVALVTTIGAVTITITAFAISHAETVYRWIQPLLKLWERARTSESVVTKPTILTDHVVLFGYHRLGERIAATLEHLTKPLLIIDFNPDVVGRLVAAGKLCLYGDMSDTEILDRANVSQASMIISTIPDVNDNLQLLQDITHRGLTVPVYVTATTWHDTRDLYKAGAHYVIFTHYLSAEHFSLMLQELHLNPNCIKNG